MRTIIAGSRTVTNGDHVVAAMSACGFQVTRVVSGCAAGVDRLGEAWAAERHLPLDLYPADWERLGKRAGPVRNEKMAENADALVAIMVKSGSPGTKDMIRRAKRRGLRVYVHLV